jgi:hypothetical protein
MLRQELQHRRSPDVRLGIDFGKPSLLPSRDGRHELSVMLDENLLVRTAEHRCERIPVRQNDLAAVP